jgi:hypothetical protein
VILVLVSSHNVIGKTIYNYILANLGVKLSLQDIKNGCMMPDFHPKFMSIPHYKSKSFETIAQMILSLQNTNFSVSPKHMSRFSTDLGIILHYITDYFCYPHNDAEADKMPYHVFYEIKLDKELRKYISSPFWMLDMNLEVEGCSNFRTSLIDLIEVKHKRYMNERPNLLNDVIYGLQSCCVVASEVINSVILKSSGEVA